MTTRHNPTRLLLVDDHTLFRESLRRLLESEMSLRICGDFASAEEALTALHAGLEFDAALIDYELNEDGAARENGLDLVRRIRSLRPDARILMVTAGMGTSEIVQAVLGLNVGIFLKTEPTVELMLAIQRTAQGERWISSRASLALISSKSLPEIRETREQFSPRESRVLRGVLEGRTNKEIGAELDLTESSVKGVLQKLFEKSGVRSRSQLVRYAIEAQIETHIDPKG
jgi:DNA-binding NarL/FixJ family response regulator